MLKMNCKSWIINKIQKKQLNIGYWSTVSSLDVRLIKNNALANITCQKYIFF